MKFSSIIATSSFALLVSSTTTSGFQVQPILAFSARTASSSSSFLQIASQDYLSTLSDPSIGASAPVAAAAPPTRFTNENDPISFHHAPKSHFDISLLTPKGPRANADVGTPHDSSKPFTKIGAVSSGSWWCAAGGWPSLTPRATTEVFYVLEGHGCLTDVDHTEHYFGPGDTVILPKGWSGRWDVLQDIHKVWFVHDHPSVEFNLKAGEIIPATVVPYCQNVEPLHLQETALEHPSDADHPPMVEGYTHILYDKGPTTVGTSSRVTGSATTPLLNLQRTVSFHVLEGVFFLTNAHDGTAQRCVAGDTIVLPKGWTGQRDVVQPVRELWVTVQE